jgi:hypothetical protein
LHLDTLQERINTLKEALADKSASASESARELTMELEKMETIKQELINKGAKNAQTIFTEEVNDLLRQLEAEQPNDPQYIQRLDEIYHKINTFCNGKSQEERKQIAQRFFNACVQIQGTTKIVKLLIQNHAEILGKQHGVIMTP